MNQGELTRPIGPEVLRQPEGPLMSNTTQGSPSQLLYQRPMTSRYLQRHMPEMTAQGNRVRAVENLTVRADLSLNQMTPEAVRNSRDSRQTLVTQTKGDVNKGMAWARTDITTLRRPNPTQRDLGEVSQDFPSRISALATSRFPKRNGSNMSIFDDRNAQDARLYQSSGKQIREVLEKRAPSRTAFVTHATDRTAVSIDQRNDTLFNHHVFNPLKTDDPRLTLAPVGTAVVRKAAGYATRPENSRA